MATESKYLTLQAAAEALGTSRRRLWQMIRAGELEALVNPLDRREKLIPRAEVERLSEFSSRIGVSPQDRQPHTFGIVDDPRLQSEEVEDYVLVHWRPD